MLCRLVMIMSLCNVIFYRVSNNCYASVAKNLPILILGGWSHFHHGHGRDSFGHNRTQPYTWIGTSHNKDNSVRTINNKDNLWCHHRPKGIVVWLVKDVSKLIYLLLCRAPVRIRRWLLSTASNLFARMIFFSLRGDNVWLCSVSPEP